MRLRGLISTAGPRLRAALACAGIVLAALAAYAPAIRGGMIWDDDAHVTKPALRSVSGLAQIWLKLGATQQYYPVLHSAFWAEHRLWGDATAGYHLVNILLHATSACLLVLLLRRLSVPGAWLAGLVFALHPVCVESVAWISEQKNTLSTALYLLSAIAFLRWRGIGQGPHRAGAGAYALASALFVLALLTKSVTATLPAALLVVIWWREGGLSWSRDCRPLLPWLVLGGSAGYFTAWVERTYIGAQGTSFDLSLLERCLLAGRVVWFYLGKLVWPQGLVFIYPRWQIDAGSAGAYAALVLFAAASAGLWLLRDWSRSPLAAWLLFCGTLFPVLGFFNVYPFVFSFVADHFQYLAMPAVIALACAGWARWNAWARSEGPGKGAGGPLRRALPVAAAAAAVAALGLLTRAQCAMYRDADTLYRTTIRRNPQCWMAYNNLGVVLVNAGRLREGIEQYEQALRIKPDYAVSQNDLGAALFLLHDIRGAIAHIDEALKLWPNYAEAHYNRGRALAEAGRLPEAIEEFDTALSLKPDKAEARNNLATALAMTGRLPEAIEQFEETLRISPDYADAHKNLGYALLLSRRPQEARTHYEEAVRLKPDFVEARLVLGNILAQAGDLDGAIEQFERAVAVSPQMPVAHELLGKALLQAGRAEEARPHLEAAQRLQGRP